ncbi:MAG: hypothetical protein PHG80_03685 [Methanoregulaceae archaeon]|nr:hypothetical protein [Methanoregulaceae archaeon]
MSRMIFLGALLAVLCICGVSAEPLDLEDMVGPSQTAWDALKPLSTTPYTQTAWDALKPLSTTPYTQTAWDALKPLSSPPTYTYWQRLK